MSKMFLGLAALLSLGIVSVNADSTSATQSFASSAKDFFAKAREAREKKAASGSTAAASKKYTKAPSRRKQHGSSATDAIRSALQKHTPKKRSTSDMSAAAKAKIEKGRALRQARLAAQKTAQETTKKA